MHAGAAAASPVLHAKTAGGAPWCWARLAYVLLLAAELGGVVVGQLLKGLAPVGKVAGVDADLLKRLGHQHGHRGLEVDVRHQRRVVPARRGATPACSQDSGSSACWRMDAASCRRADAASCRRRPTCP